MLLRALVVDDEPFVRRDLRELLAPHSDVEVAWEAGDVQQARNVLHDCSPDLVFLDVQLRGESGFDLVPCIPPASVLIFVTAHEQYALRAFEVNALDYLLKPISGERLARSLTRIRQRRALSAPPAVPEKPVASDDRLLVRGGNSQDFVKVQDIEAITSLGGNYTSVHCVSGQELIARQTFKQWEALLPRAQFVRIHRAVIVNLRHVRRAARDEAGGIEVIMARDGRTFPVSRRFAPALRAAIGRA